MPLPTITIPDIPLPIEIPELLHPAIVHFVIAIPIVILLLEIYNLGVKRRSISVFSLLLLMIVAVAMFASYLTGTVDGKATWDALGAEGQTDLKAHKLLGMYLVYASLGLVLFKLLFMAIGKTFGRILFILILCGFIAVTLYQGKEGGELVYKYGANNEAVANIKSNLEDAIDERDELQEKLDEAKEEAPKATPVEPTKEEAPKATPVESTKEEAPKATPVEPTKEEAPKATSEEPTKEEAPKATPEESTKEEAPKATPVEPTKEETPKATPTEENNAS